MKLKFSWQLFENSSNTKFHKNSTISNRAISRGQTDRHDEANGCF